MPIATDNLSAVCFDLGNTLIEWGPKQAASQYAALEQTLGKLFGHCDGARLRAIRNRQARAPYKNGYRENVLSEISRELVAELYDVVAEPQHIRTVIATRHTSFLESVVLPDGVDTLLENLSSRYRLGMISNYPYSEVIRAGLEQMGIASFFEEVVVSADVGFIKPHPMPFEKLLSGMELLPSECIHIGDNWLADIQGAKKMGMQAVFTTQHEPNEGSGFEPEEVDIQPDASIAHIDELRELLLV